VSNVDKSSNEWFDDVSLASILMFSTQDVRPSVKRPRLRFDRVERKSACLFTTLFAVPWLWSRWIILRMTVIVLAV
jgi:hypothetical protein